MAPLHVSIDIFGDQRINRRLLRVADHAQDLTPAWWRVSDALENLEREQFDTEGDPSGGWAPLAPATVAKRGSAHPILVQTGALKLSLTGGGHADAIRDVTPEQLLFGTSDRKARLHHDGTSRMPARPLLHLRETDKRNVIRIIQDHVLG